MLMGKGVLTYLTRVVLALFDERWRLRESVRQLGS